MNFKFFYLLKIHLDFFLNFPKFPATIFVFTFFFHFVFRFFVFFPMPSIHFQIPSSLLIPTLITAQFQF